MNALLSPLLTQNLVQPRTALVVNNTDTVHIQSVSGLPGPTDSVAFKIIPVADIRSGRSVTLCFDMFVDLLFL